MKPGRTLLPLFTVAVAGVGIATARFVTSTITTHVSAPHTSHAATLQARQQGNVETFHETITRTVQNGHGGGGSSSDDNSNRARPSKSSSNDGGDSNTNTNSDGGGNGPTTTQNLPQPSSTSDNNDDNSSTSITTSLPSTETSSSSSSSSTSTTTDQPKPKSSTALSAGMAAGIAAGAVAGLALLAALAFLVWRRRQGGIRGAVVTAEYPRDMVEAMETSDPKLPPASPELDGDGDGDELGGGVGGGGGGIRGGGEGQEYDPAREGFDSAEGDLGGGGGGSGGGGNDGQPSSTFRIPPAGTMPGEPGFQQQQPYPLPSQHQPPPPPHQSWLPGGDLADPRPISAFTTHPSPGQPVFPVSPLTPYYYSQQQQQQQPDSLQQPHDQDPSRYQQRRSSSYPNPNPRSPDPRSPDLPAYMIPGGNRSRAMSFSSVSRVDGGPARVVGSPPPPVPVPVRSVVGVIEGGGGRASVRQSRTDYGR